MATYSQHFCLGLALLFIGHAQADYKLDLTSSGGSQITAHQGDSFTLDATLTPVDGGQDQVNVGIFRLEFSAPGLIYTGYSWMSPFANASLDDDSKPLVSNLPVALSENTVAGAGYPAGVVDIELSNVIEGSTMFSSGTLVRLNFAIPGDSGANTIMISPVPDSFANGFTLIPTSAGAGVQVTVVPEPTAGSLYLLFAFALAPLMRRRKHNAQQGS